MGTLGNISAKQATKAFGRAGWTLRNQVGSHLVMTKPGHRQNLSIPQERELATGLLRGLIRSTGLTVEEFLHLL